MQEKNILVIGSGGREHAICWKLSQSFQVKNIFVLPGSHGIEQINKVKNVKEVNAKDFKEISNWCKENSIDLVIVGPEDPLANGLADEIKNVGINCFGPSKEGAKIESDKNWAKNFMIKYKIPTARYESFTNVSKAKDFIKNATYNALVVKASGLAAGKGVVVAENCNQAFEAIDEILGSKKYGTAGDIVVIEEKLTGEEVSVLAFVDSNTVQLMLPAQDHKRLKENDQGPNTGGMGAYCPCPLISNEILEYVKKDILQKAVDGLREEGIQYCGVLYAGLMLTPDGPKVLEFNCRFGDPETQVILPLLESDLYEIMAACCENKLSSVNIRWKSNLCAVGVVMASAGYPETSTKGCKIEGIPSDTDTRIIFHSGISKDNSGNYVTNGGRVLIAVCLNSNLRLAAMEATKVCQQINFSGKEAQFRTDIALKAFKFDHSNISLSYKDSGVDIDAGEDLVQRIKPLARASCRSGVVGGIGGFGGLFSLNELNYKNPVICEITSGVKSKIKFALDNELFENVGYDLVAECVNKILEFGAEPIAFLDYIACGKLQVSTALQFIKGMSSACRSANCAILGGETAEMPSLYSIGKYDIAGYCVGVLEDGFDLPRFDKYEDGDILVGLPTTALSCNVFPYIFELTEKLGTNLKKPLEFGDVTKSLAQVFLQPSEVYVNELLPLIRKNVVKSISYISSGILKGIKNVIPKKYKITINAENFSLSDLYGWLAVKGELCDETVLKNFNCGIGIVFIVSKLNNDWKNIKNARILGEIHNNINNQDNSIIIENFNSVIELVANKFYCGKNIKRLRNLNGKSREGDFGLTIKEIQQKTFTKDTFLTQGGKHLLRVPKTVRDPILVIGTDGVGTKVKIAQELKLNSTVGVDLVAMCVNDILCNGAEPYSFLCYYACGYLNKDEINDITSGVAEGCNQAVSSLIDFEAVEIPLLYKKGTYDLAGFSLGIAERDSLLPKVNDIREGDIIIGLPSSGVHSNGFSLIHKIIDFAGVTMSDKAIFGDKTFGEEFLKPTKIYVRAIKPLLEKKCIKGLAHITGGGLLENVPRILSKDLGARIDARSFDILPIFGWLAKAGNITNYEMQRTYNCGLGMCIIIDPLFENLVMEHLRLDHKATVIGSVFKRKSTNTPQVLIDNFDKSLKRVQEIIYSPKKRIAVLISGNGTNLQALINSTGDASLGMGAEIVVVLSNKAGVRGLERAQEAKIPSYCVSHKDYNSREEFDDAMTEILERYQVDFICLAGFMRLLSNKFVRKWKGKLINIHPSLLPKYPGLNVQQKALDAGDSESGCTVHFVDEGLDSGSIILQEKVPILPNDDVETLTNRIHKAEHFAFPRALKLITTGIVSLGKDGNTIFNY